KGTSPQFGRVTAVALEEDADGLVLVGDVELHDAMASAYREGFFTKWSIGAKRRPQDQKRYLHHLAFLGATPPAVTRLKTLKDLGAVELADGEELDLFTFSDPNPEPAMAAKPKDPQDPKAQTPDPAAPAKPEPADDPKPEPKEKAGDVEMSDEAKSLR